MSVCGAPGGMEAELRFVIELVDMLAARHGFDPAELRSSRTGAPLGPALERLREALRSADQPEASSNGHFLAG